MSKFTPTALGILNARLAKVRREASRLGAARKLLEITASGHDIVEITALVVELSAAADAVRAAQADRPGMSAGYDDMSVRAHATHATSTPAPAQG